MNCNSKMRIYDRREAIIFRKTNDLFGGLSNMASGYRLRVNNIEILTSEALYQACRFPHMPEVQRLIIAQLSPMTAKMKSKPYRKHTRADWDSVKVKIMRWCLRLKLAQNWRKFADLLISTNSRDIVEESKRDNFWGAKPKGDWVLEGENILGRLLMELREELKNKNIKGLLNVEPPDIPHFLILEEYIGIIRTKRDDLDLPLHEPSPSSLSLKSQLTLFE
jgi:type I restriction enzyme, S subunit